MFNNGDITSNRRRQQAIHGWRQTLTVGNVTRRRLAAVACGGIGDRRGQW